MHKTGKFLYEFFKKYRLTITVALVVAFTIFFFQPLSFYLSNDSEFWFTPGQLTPIISVVSLTAFVFILFFLLVCERVFKKGYLIVFLCVMINVGLFIQGSIIPDHNGVLDGSLIDWKRINTDMIASVGLWLIIVGSYLIVARKDRIQIMKIVKFLLGCEVMIELITILVFALALGDYDRKNNYVVTDEGEYVYSENKNFVVLLLDNFDSGDFVARIDDDVKDIFCDFTYFPDTLSVYGHTDLSLPQIITGKKYYNEEPYGDYLRSAYSESEFLDYFIRNNWDMGIYTTCQVPSSQISEQIDNWYKTDLTISSKRRFIYYEYKLVAYRCMPYCFKKYFWFDPSIMNELRSVDEADIEPYSWDNQIFYEHLKVALSDNEEGCFRFIHLKGMHGPNNLDRYLKPVDVLVDDDEMFLGNMLLINSYLNELKQSGIYDNTVIIIMADHGQFTDSDGEWKQNPLLLVKGFDEKHDFTMSEQRVSYDDLQHIYMSLLDGQSSADATDILDKSDPRTFLRYDYDPNELRNTDSAYVSRIREYISYGCADDIDALCFTGREYVH